MQTNSSYLKQALLFKLQLRKSAASLLLNYTHSLFLMTLTETITVDLQGTSRQDSHLDLRLRLSE